MSLPTPTAETTPLLSKTSASTLPSYAPKYQKHHSRTKIRVFERSSFSRRRFSQHSSPSSSRSTSNERSRHPESSGGSTLSNSPTLTFTNFTRSPDFDRDMSSSWRYPESIAVDKSRKISLLRFNFWPALVLENSGSVARDHLASERTFLAYVRTSLAIASAGVALIQLFALSSSNNLSGSVQMPVFAKPLGASVVILGFSVLIIGVIRYFSVQSALTKGSFPASRIAIAAMSLSLTGLVSTIFFALVSERFMGWN